MAYDILCEDEAGGLTLAQFQSLNESGRLWEIYKSLQEIASGTTPPAYGTVVLEGGTAEPGDGDVIIPAGWTSITWAASPENTLYYSVGGMAVPPGVSAGHGVPEGYLGAEVIITPPETGTQLLTYSVVRPV